jgi:large subunit ribosomal protein L24
MRKIRKGDRVVVLTGRDKGKSGEVVRVIPKDDRVVVAGVNMVSKHQKPGPGRAGGIERIEAAIHISNVAHLDPETDRPTRVGFRFLEDNRKVRYAKRSGEVIDR